VFAAVLGPMVSAASGEKRMGYVQIYRFCLSGDEAHEANRRAERFAIRRFRKRESPPYLLKKCEKRQANA
jgi:hypothetical protein